MLAPPSEGESFLRHRVIRTFARLGALSATSDPSVRGLSHVLAFRPTGNLIASTQRFGGPQAQWAPGRDGRHDLVFFERNGLRHGEFSLREDGPAQREGVKPGDNGSAIVPSREAWTRKHEVKELAWNADGSVLAVWIRRQGDAAPSKDKTVDVGKYNCLELLLGNSRAATHLASGWLVLTFVI